jgi:hypothetical protein
MCETFVKITLGATGPKDKHMAGNQRNQTSFDQASTRCRLRTTNEWNSPRQLFTVEERIVLLFDCEPSEIHPAKSPHVIVEKLVYYSLQGLKIHEPGHRHVFLSIWTGNVSIIWKQMTFDDKVRTKIHTQ